MVSLFDFKGEKESAKIQLIPVPWEGTASYGLGSRLGPHAIRDASSQLDFFDCIHGELLSKQGVVMLDEAHWIHENSVNAQELRRTEGINNSNRELINVWSDKVNDWVTEQMKKIWESGKIPSVVGGEHSVAYGAIRFVSETLDSENFGILHFDAHMDLRKSYEGLKHSHASVMYNCFSDFKNLTTITQVGVRDFCREEWDFTQVNKDSFFVFTDEESKALAFAGESWKNRVDKILETLPDKIWISFDIDGLDPQFCPHTGTPVPGGLSYDEAVFLVRELRKTGKKVLGFDLSEVSPSLEHSDLLGPSDPTQAIEQWDGNVGARILFELCQSVLI